MSVPETIGKYRVLDLIGAGGFGRVYRAADPFLDREVAIKLCSLEDRELLARFAREARISGSLQHPNIVVVHDFGFEGERPYLVQELLAGRDLDRIIRDGEWIPFPVRFSYLLQIADALAYAHDRHVIHRDVKPDNIRVLPDGQIKVMDFGIARFAHAGSRLTTAGMSLGTIGYLAPEQVRGEEVDERADLFSFGVLGYELLSYRRPFEAESAFTVLHHILQRDPVPLSVVWPACPPAVDEIFMRCLEREKERRFASFREVLVALRRAFEVAESSGLLPEAPPDDWQSDSAADRRGPSELDLTETRPLDSGRITSEIDVATHLRTRSGGTGRRRLAGWIGALGRLVRPKADRPPLPPPTPASDRAPSHSYDTAMFRLGRGPLIAVVGILLLVAAGVWLGTRYEGLPVQLVRGSAPAPPLPAIPQAGELGVDARPWASIDRIVDDGGEVWETFGSTPLSVELPVGHYTVVLSHPDFVGPVQCQVRVEGGTSVTCSEDLLDLEVADYLREVGWYR